MYICNPYHRNLKINRKWVMFSRLVSIQILINMVKNKSLYISFLKPKALWGTRFEWVINTHLLAVKGD